MKTPSFILSISFLLSNLYHHSGVAHDVSEDHQHDEANHIHYDNDESFYHIHFDHDHDDHEHHHHDHTYRGLRMKEMSTPMEVGNHTYASKQEFIESGHRCAAKKPSRKKMKESNEKLTQWMTDNKHRMDQTTNVEVQTYFHVITSGRTGAISNATLKSQLSVLNDLYKAHGFSFKLIKTTRTNNANWYRAGLGSSTATAMFQKLRVGGASTLNIYFNGAGGYLGYATLPTDYVDSPVRDGVVVASGSVPGGSITYYNEGKTLVHEVGHWLGLLHTFQTDHFSGNACLGNGDYVPDTPRQRYPTEGCPVRKDTCPRSGGVDMVSNFMDYSDDVCLTTFTTGQKNRMHAMWDSYRA